VRECKKEVEDVRGEEYKRNKMRRRDKAMSLPFSGRDTTISLLLPPPLPMAWDLSHGVHLDEQGMWDVPHPVVVEPTARSMPNKQVKGCQPRA
jgi:hypothetical protein